MKQDWHTDSGSNRGYTCMNQQEKALYLPKSKDVLNWKIKTFARSPREMKITQSIFIAVYMTGSTLYMWGGWIMFSDSLYSLVGTILALAGILAYYLCAYLSAKKPSTTTPSKPTEPTSSTTSTTPTSPPPFSKASP
ncbi:Permease [Pseudomonas syringae pv. papulans]|nr:Permease [Pseudomonas syringae pv. papulans]RMN39700.1 Permease [Pseudomonas syringae pv. papulans]